MPEQAAPRASRPLAIALIDDNPDIRETMFDLLTTWGHNVETAADGPSGVELILRTQPDLAFVDIGLPRLDGYGVAAQVREQLGDKRTRLVAMSGFGQEADRRRSLEVGFNAHLVKPADIDAILNVLSPLHDAGDVNADHDGIDEKRPTVIRPTIELDRRLLLAALRAFGRGEFDTRLPDDLDGVDGQICEIVQRPGPVRRIAARRGGRAAPAGGARGPHPPPAGSHARPRRLGGLRRTGSTRCSTTSPPTRPRWPAWSPPWPGAIWPRRSTSTARTCPCAATSSATPSSVNGMVSQLAAFGSEVTRVAQEVGVDGKLGAQARVRGVSGVWKELTDSVNLMASNLTAQVREIARVTTAVAQGDLTRRSTSTPRARSSS